MHNQDEFFQLAKNFLNEIALLRQTVETAFAKRESDKKREAEVKEAQSQAPRPTIPVNIVGKDEIWGTQAERGEKERKSDKHFGINAAIQGALALFTLAAFIAAAYYAAVAAQQRDTMDKTLTQITKQTDDNHRYLVGTQAAVLSLGMSYSPDGDGKLTVGVSNIGHITATDLYLRAEAQQVRTRDGEPFGESLVFEPQLRPLTGGGADNKDFQLPWHYKPSSALKDGWPQDWPGAISYVLRAKVTYKNGFNELRSETLCRRWLPGWSLTVAPGRGFSGGGLQDCKDVQSHISSSLEYHRQAEQYANEQTHR